MCSSDLASNAAQGAKRQAAILLSPRASRNGGLHIVARRDLLNPREPLEATYGNPPTTINLGPGTMMETGQDFDWLRYTLLNTII